MMQDSSKVTQTAESETKDTSFLGSATERSTTRTEAPTLTAGRALDALVAEKVMGFVHCKNWRHNDQTYPNTYCFAKPDSPTQGGEARSYSTDIEAAWEVVEKFNLSVVCSADGWYAVKPYDIEHRYDSITLIVRGVGVTALADTAPLAICLAALKAVKS